MMGRTHDLAAFTALNLVVINYPINPVSFGTAICALAACFIGGLAPDLDQPTSNLWRKLPGGLFIGGIVSPVFVRHRFISHSILGLVLFGFITKAVLSGMSSFLLVDIKTVWNAFMIGFISHLVMDAITRDGIPIFFPFKPYIGIPPFEFLRLKTGGVLEKYLVFPGLLIFNGYLFLNHYAFYLDLFHKLS